MDLRGTFTGDEVEIERYIRELAGTGDEEKLIQIALYDSDLWVREIATSKIKNHEVLAKMAKTDPEWGVRLSAVARLAEFNRDDQDFFIEIAKTDSHQNVRSVAVRAITDQKVLIEIARTDSHFRVRVAAIETITDQKVLIEIATNIVEEIHYYWKVRVAATSRITNQKVLAEIAKTDSDWMVCKAAVNAIIDQEILTDIVETVSDAEVRMEAIKKLDDDHQDLFIRIAKNDPNRCIRETAVGKIIDQDVLAEMTKTESDWIVCMAIIKSVTDRKALIKILKTGLDQDICMRAVDKLVFSERNFFAKIVEKRFSENMNIEVDKRKFGPESKGKNSRKVRH